MINAIFKSSIAVRYGLGSTWCYSDFLLYLTMFSNRYFIFKGIVRQSKVRENRYCYYVCTVNMTLQPEALA